MRVKELVEKLQQMDPEATVYFEDACGDCITYEDVEVVRPYEFPNEQAVILSDVDM